MYSLYSITQVKRPSLTKWSIMHHTKEGLWSSLGPKCEIFSRYSEDLIRFKGSHLEFLNALSVEARDQIPTFTRAIHYQEWDNVIIYSIFSNSINFK